MEGTLSGNFEAAALIARAIALYGQLADDLRFDTWGELFTEDAVLAMPGRTFEGREAIVREVRAMESKTPGLVRRLYFTPVIEFDSATSARSWTDFMVTSRVGDDRRWEVRTVGRYSDELVESGDRWLFARRVCDYDPINKPDVAFIPGPLL
jgi:hypothetical protein